MQQNISKINQLFDAHKVKAQVENIREGLRTCEYLIKLDVGEKVSRIRGLSEELSLVIQSLNEPSIKLDTRSGHVVVETTVKDDPITIPLRDILIEEDSSRHHLPLVLGKDMYNRTFTVDLAECPHLLIGGATGTGKSVLSKSMICSLVSRHTPTDLQFVLVDPKGTELHDFKDSKYCIRHLVDIEEAQEVFQLLVQEMKRRYDLLGKKGLNNINQLSDSESEPYLVVMIDELADLLMQDTKKKLYTNLVRLLQKARAAGIHIIANTQRPSREVCSGLLKGNMPVQIALQTASNYDSRVIIGEDGAEKLVGKGDMLVKYQGEITRVQGAIAF